MRDQEAAANAVAAPQGAAPSNDTCAGAEVIPTTLPALSSIVDIADATTAGDPPLPGASCYPTTTLSRSIWFKFTPAVTAAYAFSSCATETATTLDDPVMAIYSSSAGCSGPFTLQACDDNGCAFEFLQARVTRTLVAGTDYYILVWNFTDDTVLAPGNTEVQLRVSAANPPANETCAGAIPLQLNRSTAGTFGDAENDYQLAAASPCFPGTVGQSATTAPGQDLVYSFTAPAAGNYSFKVWNVGGMDPVLYLAGSCPAATPGSPVNVNCTQASNRSGRSEEISCVALTAGQQVFLFVDQVMAVSALSFYIQVENCPSQETEPNDTPGTANVAACRIQGSIVAAGDVDFYSIGMWAADSRVFAMVDSAASTSSDADLRVTTATDTLEYDDFDNGMPWGPNGPNVAGTRTGTTPVGIFLRVSGFGASTEVDPYHLYSVVQPPLGQATVEIEPNDTTATAQGAANNYFSGNLAGPAPSADQDFYGFQATQAT